ncbi:DUF433 domain-containing protein [Fimbriimonas ginsengisoli]|uniref:DUF433 domain-containing protein n=1 Tax=Fimbriimonas ginsengisoli Gsoil 348 TaxID=661478 RepID=A0A068NV07_FIMGI|nr:DUF433 domain-containing protein [Fimbriimonas ginsengisoli]AIE85429.1 hypothetical protein OP10G_2061 [Fimbriimonas ginsengisoli Gsoil 348]
MIPQELTDILSADSETLGGTVCFRNTRVPVKILFDHVNHGTPLEEFLLGYPSVPKTDALRVLEWEEQTALAVLEADAA